MLRYDLCTNLVYGWIARRSKDMKQEQFTFRGHRNDEIYYMVFLRALTSENITGQSNIPDNLNGLVNTFQSDTKKVAELILRSSYTEPINDGFTGVGIDQLLRICRHFGIKTSMRLNESLVHYNTRPSQFKEVSVIEALAEQIELAIRPTSIPVHRRLIMNIVNIITKISKHVHDET